MFAEATMRAIAAAQTTELDHITREVWRAYGAGILDDAAAQAATDAIQARRAIAKAEAGHSVKGPPQAPAQRRQRSPDRQASIERRRRMVGTIAMPSALASRFTWGEQAVHRVVGNEVKKHGVCTLPIDAIAAMAGVHRTTVQNALREGQGKGEVPGVPIISVQQRRRRGQRSLTNIVRIISPEWLAWLYKGPSASSRAILGEGSNKKLSTTNTGLFLKGRAAEPPPWGIPDGVFSGEAVT
jgi:hypothetical protein